MTEQEEQDRLKAELSRKYGERIFKCACEMSGLRNALQALACDELSKDERAHAYVIACAHLAKWQAMHVTPEDSSKLMECAERIDSAVQLWMVDDMERRDGLPRL